MRRSTMQIVYRSARLLRNAARQLSCRFAECRSYIVIFVRDGRISRDRLLVEKKICSWVWGACVEIENYDPLMCTEQS